MLAQTQSHQTLNWVKIMFYLYPKIYYKVNDFDFLKVTDLSVTTKISGLVNKYRQTNPRPYIIKDGELPNMVSYRVYGDSKYEYIILLTNEIRNVYDEWPKSYKILNEYVEQKYGSLTYANNNYGKYYTSDGREISEAAWAEQSITDPAYYRLTHYEYEVQLNDEKSKIKIMNPSLAVQFEIELQEMISKIEQVE